MLFFTLQGPPRISEGAAVAAAIAEATAGYGDLAQKIHINVIQVLKIDGEWCAMIRIGIEQKPEEDDEEELKKKLEKKPLPKQEAKQEAKQELKPAPEEEPTEPKKDMQFQKDVHVYLPETPDVSYIYHLFQPYPEYHYHMLGGEGSLWNASLTIHPDVDLYEAAHAVGYNYDFNNEPVQKLAPRLKKRAKGLVFDLDDEII